MFKAKTSDITQKHLLTRKEVVTIAPSTYKTSKIQFFHEE